MRQTDAIPRQLRSARAWRSLRRAGRHPGAASLPLIFALAGCNVDTVGDAGQGAANAGAEQPQQLVAPATPAAGSKPAQAGQAATRGAAQPSGEPEGRRTALDLSLKVDHSYAASPAAGQFQQNVLPDMFDREKEENKLSVSGSLLREEGVDDFADAVNGAAVSIELKTD